MTLKLVGKSGVKECPICLGKGSVPCPPTVATRTIGLNGVAAAQPSAGHRIPCPECNGKKVVLGDNNMPEEQADKYEPDVEFAMLIKNAIGYLTKTIDGVPIFTAMTCYARGGAEYRIKSITNTAGIPARVDVWPVVRGGIVGKSHRVRASDLFASQEKSLRKD